MNCKMKRKLVWLPALLVMIVIFYFSNQPAEVSGDLSGGISYRVVEMMVSIMELDWNQDEISLLAEKIDYPIRKLAHLTEYALLGMAVALGVVYGSDLGQRSRYCQYLLTQMIGSGYAVSDEIHQLFVPGRAGMVSDVLIDSCGVLIGWGVFCTILWVVSRRKQGSGIGFVHNETKRVLQFDQPHPGNELYGYQIKKTIQFLKDIGEID